MPSLTTFTRVLTNEALTGSRPFSFTSATATVRAPGSTNTFYFVSSAAFGATTTGSIKLEGRLSSDASFAPVYNSSDDTLVEVDGDLVLFPFRTVASVSTPSFLEQRWVTDDLDPQASGDFVVNAWIFQ